MHVIYVVQLILTKGTRHVELIRNLDNARAITILLGRCYSWSETHNSGTISNMVIEFTLDIARDRIFMEANRTVFFP